jgi:hypothetical protein
VTAMMVLSQTRCLPSVSSQAQASLLAVPPCWPFAPLSPCSLPN